MRKSAKLVAVAATLLVVSCFGIQAAGIEGGGFPSDEAAPGKGWATEEQWVDFEQGIEGDVSYVTVLDSSVASLTLGVALPGMYTYPVEMADGNTYTAVETPGASLFDVSMPAVPVFGEWILIPNDTDPTLEVTPGDPLIFEGLVLPPGQLPLVFLEGALDPPFTKDEAAYGLDADTPGEFVRLEQTKIMRGQEATVIWLYPFQHNPVQETLAVYPDLTVTVHFEGEMSPIPARLRSESFDDMMRGMAINADAIISAQPDDSEPPSHGQPGPYGWDYLIFTDPTFGQAANKLAAWKKKQGFKTLVTQVPSKWKASDIKKALLGAYKTWDVVPKYVLLLGDAEHIPTFYKTWHPFNGNNVFRCTTSGLIKEPDYSQGYTGTDLYYTTLQGPDANDPDSDLVPEVIIGRLSVDKSSEAMDRVDAIIKYEQDPVTDSAFYNNAAIGSQFQDLLPVEIKNSQCIFKPDKYEDKRCTQTSEDLAQFLSEAKYNVGKSVDRIYNAESGVDPQYWSKESSNFGGGPAGNPSAAIPTTLRKPTFPWNGGTNDITTAINAGRFLLTYRGHGGRQHWKAPYFHANNVSFLANGDRLPVVWTTTCQTGWFDNETDFKKQPGLTDRTGYYDIHFSEAWERNSSGGAVGVIAGTRVTYGSYNERLVWGMTDAIWPDFIKYGGVAGVGSQYRMGDVLNLARQYMVKMCPDTKERKANYEAYHWFGDPAMEIRTVRPPLIAVISPSPWPWLLYPKDFTLCVEWNDPDDRYTGPIEKAKVTVSKRDNGSDTWVGTTTEGGYMTQSKAGGSSDYWVGWTDAEGNVTFPNLITSDLGEYDVVVTAPQAVPFQGTFESLAGSAGGVLLDSEVYSCTSEIEIKLADADLAGVEALDAPVTTTGDDREDVTLMETDTGTGMFIGTISTASAGRVDPGDGTLQVSDGVSITVQYYDEDDGMGGEGWVQDTAVVDCQPPAFDGLTAATAEGDSAQLEWGAATDRRGWVTYNIYRDQYLIPKAAPRRAETESRACSGGTLSKLRTPFTGQVSGGPIGDLIGTASALSFPDYDCDPGQTCYYVVRAQDAVGNEDDNTVELSVTIPIPGDVDGNCQVDVTDVQETANRWRLRAEIPHVNNDPGGVNYETRFDLDWDGDVDTVDVMGVVARWGESCD